MCSRLASQEPFSLRILSFNCSRCSCIASRRSEAIFLKSSGSSQDIICAERSRIRSLCVGIPPDLLFLGMRYLFEENLGRRWHDEMSASEQPSRPVWNVDRAHTVEKVNQG